MEVIRIILGWFGGTVIGTLIGIFGMKAFMDWRKW
jgi:hypothetical protein